MCVKPFGRIHTMARPNKLFKETMSYNLTIEKKDYEDLKNFSTKESDTKSNPAHQLLRAFFVLGQHCFVLATCLRITGDARCT